MNPSSGYLLAVGAALLWALATPFSKVLLDDVRPMVLAGLSYLGAGVGLTIVRLLGRARSEAPLARGDAPVLALIVACGGVLAPLCLLEGLRTTPAAAASLLSCLEVVFTVLVAAVLFREAVPLRVMAAAGLMTAGGAVLALDPGGVGLALSLGALLVAAGSACWAVDSNLTRRLAHKDPIELTAAKGLLAGTATLVIAYLGGQPMPPADALLPSLLLGFVCYGASLVLYTRALRALGAARTASIFAISPFLGALIALPLLSEEPTPRLGVAGLLMGLGTVLVLRERHEHAHAHEPLDHEHAHVHDAHHQHAHDGSEGDAPHSHRHRHEAVVHRHAHVPDIHHRHAH